MKHERKKRPKTVAGQTTKGSPKRKEVVSAVNEDAVEGGILISVNASSKKLRGTLHLLT